ncbi:Methane monooxygenase component C [Candidatus Terasakiella magnetica]|uniref:Methane monooxygenase component C n=1 Tax=Candidatus Terasakiella magnetica TaxID=1867952 RepID=A0A1C3REV4_9PROT|nr:2Fe-2S iron-sulfur cluster binding domain-containing protein [Candidatus Terasakiella magnetica]SCA55799.1 Methane monooxygenase component C [Candidatus Terasakiella magnetica]
MSNNHKINLTTRDGQTVSFECDEEKDVLSAAEEAGYTLPSVCRDGGCGTCKGNCSKGDYEITDVNPDALGEEAKAEGQVLFCRTFPKGDLDVSINSDLAHISQGPAKTFKAEVTALEDMGGDVRRMLVTVHPNENGEGCPAFEPGQFFELQIPGTDIWRAYSIANAPNWAAELEFIIRLQPNGKFSHWIANKAKVGDTLQVRGPQGSFVLQQGTINPRCFVSGGTGVAPMLSMLRLMAEFQEDNECFLFFGVNEEKDLFALDEIKTLTDSLPNLKATVCVFRPSDNWERYSGTPVDAFKAELTNLLARKLTPEVYLCGPPGLIDAAKSTAIELGLREDNVFAERFLPS